MNKSQNGNPHGVNFPTYFYFFVNDKSSIDVRCHMTCIVCCVIIGYKSCSNGIKNKVEEGSWFIFQKQSNNCIKKMQ